MSGGSLVVWRRVAFGLVALSLVACPDGEAGAQVPEGWNQVVVQELVYAVPDGFEELDPPRDPQKLVEHVRGDPSEQVELELIGVYRSPAVSTTGDEVSLVRYVDELFIVGGGLAGGYEDLEISDREELSVNGAVEAQRLTVTYFEPRVDVEVVQTVVLVRTGEHVYDLRYIAAASQRDEQVASTLPGTVHLP